jgi:hypothetical protein
MTFVYVMLQVSVLEVTRCVETDVNNINSRRSVDLSVNETVVP